jgi:hypothetical protein
MLIEEYPYKGRTDRIRHYSDIGMMIRQNEMGYLYAEAVDVYPTRFTYTETDDPIPEPEDVVPDADAAI